MTMNNRGIVAPQGFTLYSLEENETIEIKSNLPNLVDKSTDYGVSNLLKGGVGIMAHTLATNAVIEIQTSYDYFTGAVGYPTQRQDERLLSGTIGGDHEYVAGDQVMIDRGLVPLTAAADWLTDDALTISAVREPQYIKPEFGIKYRARAARGAVSFIILGEYR